MPAPHRRRSPAARTRRSPATDERRPRTTGERRPRVADEPLAQATGERHSRAARERRDRRRLHRRAARAAGELARYLRTEQIGGLILLAAAALALVLANSPWAAAYDAVAGTRFGPAALHLDLTVHAWATDGLLTLFFLVAGLELKKELVTGDLRDPRTAALPVVAALGGMVAPALVFLAVAAGRPGAAAGWAIPTATDIAFALAVLALAARRLPANLRLFLLTLAIVDDLGAIALIAGLYTDHVAPLPLLAGLAAVAGWAALQHLRVRAWWAYLPIGLVAWGCVHASGVHATVAGVLLGLATRATRDRGEGAPPVERLVHRIQPLSAGVAVPLFALFAAGVGVGGDALAGMVTDRLALGVVAGLLLGKTVGVLGACALAVRWGVATLPRDVGWRDLAAVSVLTGCGFTVSLLVTELAFGTDARADRLKLAVLTGSVAAAAVSALLLRGRVRARTA
ncbi:Na(+)/H(+) antiporter NhaA [Pilimelia terevasa]|uniref:Na(+)/H(+) antiporter NhaA n=1 Tax=Pilimelia terevasa TaxID=53372 RepID=A0A8J3BM13_9ACTN|nr:Na+/H+ antiporter NhaA [Pilimelia terevasa]GGK20905.1 Na(+)/H(+) antiporter NhaA [Pilimelia terevasa]